MDQPFEAPSDSDWAKDYARLRSGVPLAELSVDANDELVPLHQWRPVRAQPVTHYTPEEPDQPACDADVDADPGTVMFGTLNPEQVTCPACAAAGVPRVAAADLRAAAARIEGVAPAFAARMCREADQMDASDTATIPNRQGAD